jgi:transcriptional regulator with XRE-family HTH domain
MEQNLLTDGEQTILNTLYMGQKESVDVPQEDSKPVVEQPIEQPPEEKVHVAEQPEEEVQKAAPQERPVHTVPLSKFNEEREKAAKKAREEAATEYEAKMEAMKADYESKLAKSSPQHEDVVKLAEEYGYSAKDAEFIAKIIEKRTPDTSKYDQLIEEQQKQTHEAKVLAEFDEKILPLIQKQNPNATLEHINKVKQRVAELAFTEGYNTYKLEDIYRVKQDEFEFKNGYGAEPSGGRNAEMIDFSQMTDDEEIRLADEDPKTFKKFVEWQRKNTSRFW